MIPKTIKIIIKCESELALKIFINFFNIFIDCPKGRKKITAELYYSTVSFVRCGWVFPIKDNDLHFTFDLITRSSSLNKQFYSTYQYFIHDIISDKLDKGMNYKEIADWLNDNGYTTTRGKRFRNAHTHSIIKKKKMSDERHNRMYSSSLTI